MHWAKSDLGFQKHYCLKVKSCIFFRIDGVCVFHLQLLISYGDAGTKGALTDEHVFASAKCQVYFLVQHLFCDVVSVLFFKKRWKN